MPLTQIFLQTRLWSFHLSFSVLLVLLLLIHPLLLQRLGARTLYALWLSVPLILLLNLFLPYMPAPGLLPERIVVTLKHFHQPAITAAYSNLLQWLWLAGLLLGVVMMLCMHWPIVRLYQTAQKIAQYDPLPCYQTQHHIGPYVSGFWRPRIFLPADFSKRFDSQQQKLILQHEMTHWRRGDLHLNYFALALVLLFWFNPLVWLAYRRYRQDQELSCDALVLLDAKPQVRIAYGYALISNIQQACNVWQPLTYHYGDKIMMKQRLLQIQQSKGFSKVAVTSGLSLLVALGLWLQQPVYAANQQPKPVMRVEPQYPQLAAEQKMNGFVQAKFNISAAGNVTDIEIINAQPAEMFNKAAIDALKQWTYEASAHGAQGAMVQLDFILDFPTNAMEQITVTPAKKN